MPVGAVGTPDGNRLVQLARADAKERSPGSRDAGGQPLPGSGLVAGVSLGAGAVRGDLNDTSDAPVVIEVRDSTDLNALAQAVALASFGEQITVEDSAFSRLPGGISIDAGTIFERTLTLRNSTFAADVIKARGFQGGGRDALVIEGSRFDASTLVRLYAEGVSTLRFRGDVDIRAPLAQLAGRTVEVDAGGRVRVSGDVTIHADQHHYDSAGFGTIDAAGSKTRDTFPQRARY